MENLFNTRFTYEELVTKVLSNPIISNELELELVTLWSELSRYSDEAWEEIGEGEGDNVRRIIIYLPKIAEILFRNKLEEDAIAFAKLRQIVESMTGLAVKELQMVTNGEFEIEFLNPIPRPRLIK